MKCSMLLFFVLACMCPLVSTNMCIACQRGKYNTFLSNQLCKLCEADMYAPNTGMTTCLACPTNSTSVAGSASCACLPGMAWSVESTGCIPVCESGLVRTAAGGCLPPWNTSLVLNLEMVLIISPNMTNIEVQAGLKTALSDAYGVPEENLLVSVVALPTLRKRLLLEETDIVRYAVEVRVVFPSDASVTEINATKTRLDNIKSKDLNDALQVAPSGVPFVVLDSWPAGTGKDNDINSAQSTAYVSTTPSPPGTSSELDKIFDDVSIIVAVVVGAVVLLLCLVVILCCLCKDIHATKS